ncbi:hypothetical protein YYG_04052 [Plasmodium vinckei petteri]|uniref:PIR protein CIR protein n=1 Tax=Plasmodium vinckei petteri TaxID=138298 RepID=W7AI40_PLAVN|nr:hypothetical protein YYG_04052 [Plasmodium vinckei petteri]
MDDQVVSIYFLNKINVFRLFGSCTIYKLLLDCISIPFLLCDFLYEVDENFNNGGVNVFKFNRFTKCHSYCPHQNKCTNDYERINALSAYLHNKISEIDKYFKNGENSDKRHIEIFIIWLGDKLFKMENDYKATLGESYEKNLEKSMGNYNYWKVINSRKYYKNATIKKMSEYYNLLNYICKLITEYNKNPDNKRLGNYSSQCENYYKTIYNSINGCKPYLHLLDNLKMIYEIFRMQKIANNYNINENKRKRLLNRVKSLTTFGKENRLFVSISESLNFSDNECAEVRSKDEKIGEIIALKKSQDAGKSKTPTRGGQPRVSGNTQHGNTGSRNPASLQPKQLPAQSPTLKLPSGQSKFTPPAPAKPVAVKPAPPSQNDKLKTPQAGKTHQNGPGDAGSGAVDGKGGTPGGKGGTSGGKGAEKKDINRGLGSDKGSSTQVGKDGGQKSSNSDTRGPVNVPGSGAHGSGGAGVKSGDQSVKDRQEGIGGGTSGGQGIPSSGAIGGQGSQGITSSESGGSSGGTDGGKGDAGRGVNGGGSVQGDQGKGSGDPSRVNPAPAPSGTDTTPSPGASPSVSQSSTGLQSPPVPSTPQSPTPQVPTPPGTTPPGTTPPGTTPPGTTPPGTTPSPGASQPQVQQGTPPADPPVPPGQPPQTGGSSSGSKDTGDRSSDPASNTSGGSFDWGSSIFEFILKGKEYYDKASEFIEKNRQTFEDTKDKIRGAYNDTVENLKNVYNASSDYFNSVISNITSQLNQFDPPPKSGDSQTGSGSPPGGGNPSTPPIDPQPPSPPTPPQIKPPDPPPNPPKIDPPLPPPAPASVPTPAIPPDPSKGSTPNSLLTPPSNPTPNTSLDPPKGSSQQKQSPSQSQLITHQPTQINSSSQQTVVQLAKSLSSDLILKKPWNIFPTTWNGSGDCKPEIKFMNATLVCCTSEQCSLTGITVILVLIPIILLIAYKVNNNIITKYKTFKEFSLL